MKSKPEPPARRPALDVRAENHRLMLTGPLDEQPRVGDRLTITVIVDVVSVGIGTAPSDQEFPYRAECIVRGRGLP